MDYNEILKSELKGIHGDHLARISRINRNYEIYEGEQLWETNANLDYEPTKKVTNLIKKLIDTRARFMFGIEPYFDVRPIKKDAKGKRDFQDQAQLKEDLLKQILTENKFHSKLLKARKDCSIGGRIAIKLWAKKDMGVKLIFSPAQEFFPQYNLDDVDQLEKIIFLYSMNNEKEAKDQRVKKQVWEIVNNKCILNESTHDGKGKLISIEYEDYDTSLDFIPVVIIQNGGLTGDTEGSSDIKGLWDNQDNYNKLTSDDIDSLKFQMFGQNVITDAAESSLENIQISPGALIDLQTDRTQLNGGKQAKMNRLESGFSYGDKFQDTVDRIKGDMYDTLDVPNVNLEQLKGVMQSGKSMKALYWGLKNAADEDWTEWGPALEQMVNYIFKMIDIYNVYGKRKIAQYETTLKIERYYPIQEDTDEQKTIDMQEVITEVRSRESYMDKWSEVEDIETELEKIVAEKAMLQDSFTKDLMNDIEEWV